MLGIYFSGTGNTKYCVTHIVHCLDENAAVYSIEDENAVSAIRDVDTFVFGYPVYYSNIPKIVKDFIVNNFELFRGKKILIVATMGLFSGDGAGVSARLFKKYGATVLGGLHLKMPDCIGDVKVLKKSLADNKQIVSDADAKIKKTVSQIQKGKYPKEGLNIFYRLAGIFGQRLYFSRKTKNYYTGVKVDNNKCIGCGLCVKSCPMCNIELSEKSIVFKDKCTMCYRCFSKCPKEAITVLGKKVHEQCYIEKYL